MLSKIRSCKFIPQALDSSNSCLLFSATYNTKLICLVNIPRRFITLIRNGVNKNNKEHLNFGNMC